MNMAWLAAVLQPRDVIPSGNRAGTELGSSGVAQLARLVMGGDWLRGVNDEPADTEVVEELRVVEQCLLQDTIGEAVYVLANLLRDRPPADQARAAALAIFLSAAASELDEFEIGFVALDSQLERIDPQAGSDSVLLRAALYQQKALRSRDAGVPYIDYLLDVGRSLAKFDPSQCSEFTTSDGVAWTFAETAARMRTSLLRAASGLYPSDQKIPSGVLLTQSQLAKEPWSEAESRAWSKQAEEYPRFVEQQFDNWAGGARQVTVVGRRGADIFASLLGLELVGSRLVYPVRKNLAIMRLVQSTGDTLVLADAVRLLRHAGASKELTRTLRRLRTAGPLAALAHDARQVLARRLSGTGLRTLEMEVLAAASDVLTKPEARHAIGGIEASLDSENGPAGVVGHWRLHVLQREVAWTALAALAGPADAEDRVARRLLQELGRLANDLELADRGMRRAIIQMDWKRVSPGTSLAWVRALEARRDELPATFDVLASFADDAPEPAQEGDVLELLASWVNAQIRGQRQSREPPIDEDSIRHTMQKIRNDAAGGRFSVGGTDVADIVAALISAGHGLGLWPDLVEFLMDGRVARDDRTYAFDRLARADISIPSDLAVVIRQKAKLALRQTTSTPGWSGENELTPYPALLRFLGAHGLIDAAESYGFIAELSGSSDDVARREAARTIALFATRAPREELLAFVLPLSHDRDSTVRAQIAVALARLATESSALAPAAGERLLRLLDEDGLEIPLVAIRALKDASVPLSTEVVDYLSGAQGSHPSRAVRLAAADLLRHSDQHSGSGIGPEQ